MKRTQSQSGNVFFILFLAVAMFGALSYTVIRGGRTSTATVSQDQAKLGAQEIIAYGNTLAAAVQKMKLRGVLDTQFSFENSAFTTNNGTPITPAGKNPNCNQDNCKVFNMNGGAMNAVLSPKGSAENTESPNDPNAVIAGTWAEHVASIDGIGSSQKDLVILSGYIKKEFCKKINDLLDVTNPNNAPPSFVYGAGGQVYNGTFGTPSGTFSNGVVVNKSSYCYEIQNRPGVYNFMQTLIVR